MPRICADLKRLKRDRDASRSMYPIAHDTGSDVAVLGPPPAPSATHAPLNSIPATAVPMPGKTSPGTRNFRAPAWAWVLIGIAATAIGAAFAWHVVYSHRAQAFNDKDSVVLAHFVNTTGDLVFSGTLQQALTLALRQSPYIGIVLNARMQSILRLMGRPAYAKLL